MSQNNEKVVLPGGQIHNNEEELSSSGTAFDPFQQQQQQQQPQTSPLEKELERRPSDQIERPITALDDSSSANENDSDAEGDLADREIMGQEDRMELVSIARTLSRRQSTMTGLPPIGATQSQMPDAYDATLDPAHETFDLRKWLKSFMQAMQEQGIATDTRTGVSFRDVNVFGSGSAIQLQDTLWSVLSAPLRVGEYLSFGKKQPKHILHNFDGLVEAGELLIVLGRPGSGCSTLLKTLCGETHGLQLGEKSNVHFNGIPLSQMSKEFKGEANYNQEVDRHFPHLTVGQTLEFAASVRTPSHRIQNMSRQEYCRYVAKVAMAIFGLSHTYNTLVGNDFVRGVSGGERKRVSIAEMTVAGSPFSAWDNSTRGLDSATALKFVQALRMAADIGGGTQAVAIYQASQDIYDLFDKAIVLYEGRQIFFGPANQAKEFFERMGWYCPSRQTTGDFLTSVTNPLERQAREGMEKQVPRTPEEFESVWRNSPEFKALHEIVDAHEQTHVVERQGQAANALREDKIYQQSKHVRPKSAYRISVAMQVRLCTKRAYQNIWNDRSSTVAQVASQIIIALIVGSIFYGTPNGTAAFFAKGSVLFMAILFNALQAISEIAGLYAQRPIVEKHNSYAFYHPAAEAAAGLAAALPIKFASTTAFNIVLYFLAGLRREPAQFFLYFLITFMSIFIMMAVFRTLAASTKTESSALTFAGLTVLALVVYTGYTVPQPYMKVWFSWIRWINPIYYAFEILMANEFHGREFPCSSIVPPYTPNVGDSWICNVKGAVAGRYTVSGDDFLAVNYNYYYSHVWRNLGILFGFLIFFNIIYLIAIEINSTTSSTAEALVFQRGRVPAYLRNEVKKGSSGSDEEDSTGADPTAAVEKEQTGGEEPGDILPPQKDIFTWRKVIYDIKIKGEPRRLLDEVSGYVKPGTLTALMGVSGAGKTTLLDALAQRTTTGVITGDMCVNGKPLGPSFQRNTGYCQQQDLHLHTSTVRESLRFSAMLRQPRNIPKVEKYEFVEGVIKMLNMEDFADAVVGVPGEGLNVEQRKLLTIGVELAAKPKLLLFLDEPTSGLDSQSSWAICSLLRKLADSGQAILCTIHQPSAILFQSFDRLLFLAKGGKTVYFGDIGENSRTLLDYFEANGAPHCDDSANPAEYMLDVVNKGRNNKGEDWHSVWKESREAAQVQEEIDQLHKEKENVEVAGTGEVGANQEFAMPFGTQLLVVTQRAFESFIRMPSYILAKFALGIFSGLFIGFTFYQANASQQGLQNIIFSVFLITTIFSSLVQQIQPLFVTQRALYEVRERPSKAYSWKAFMISNIIVEIPFQIVTGVLIYACFYYAVIGIQDSYRQGIVLIYVIALFIYASTFAHMTIAAFPDVETAGAVVTMFSLLITIFSGVLQTPSALPGFWIFMYRVSPFTYWIGGIVSTALHGRPVTCAADEVNVFNPPSNQTCQEYLAPLLKTAGVLQNPDATSQCRYCPISVADQQLAPSGIEWSDKWRNYGIFWAYIGFNIFMAVFLYWAFRVKQWRKRT